MEEECEPYRSAGDWTCHKGHFSSCLANTKKQMKDYGPPLCEDVLQRVSYELTKVSQGTCVCQGPEMHLPQLAVNILTGKPVMYHSTLCHCTVSLLGPGVVMV